MKDERLRIPVQRPGEASHFPGHSPLEHGYATETLMPGGNATFHFTFLDGDYYDVSLGSQAINIAVYDPYYSACVLEGETAPCVWDPERNQMIVVGPHGLMRYGKCGTAIPLNNTGGFTLFHQGTLNGGGVSVENDGTYYNQQIDTNDFFWLKYLTGDKDFISTTGTAHPNLSEAKKGRWVPMLKGV